jgi:hypothetical protein
MKRKKERLINSIVEHNADQYSDKDKKTKERKIFFLYKILITCHYSHEMEEMHRSPLIEQIRKKNKQQIREK